MHKYKSLAAWHRAHALVLSAFRSADAVYHPRSRALLGQLKRAALSVELNIVEGYALGTAAQFRRHLRIALASAAEAEAAVRIAGELEYLPQHSVADLQRLADGVLGTLYGLIRRSVPLPAPRS